MSSWWLKDDPLDYIHAGWFIFKGEANKGDFFLDNCVVYLEITDDPNQEARVIIIGDIMLVGPSTVLQHQEFYALVLQGDTLVPRDDDANVKLINVDWVIKETKRVVREFLDEQI